MPEVPQLFQARLSSQTLLLGLKKRGKASSLLTPQANRNGRCLLTTSRAANAESRPVSRLQRYLGGLDASGYVGSRSIFSIKRIIQDEIF